MLSKSYGQILIAFVLILFSSCVATKDTTNLEDNYAGYKRMIDVVAQRYIIKDVLNLSQEQKIQLKINEISEDVNTYGGNMSKMFVYSYGGKKGMVVTAFNVLNSSKGDASFTNTKLGPEDLKKLNEFYLSVDRRSMKADDFHVFKINDEVTVNMFKSFSRVKIVLLMSEMNMAEIFDRKWEKVYEDFNELY